MTKKLKYLFLLSFFLFFSVNHSYNQNIEDLNKKKDENIKAIQLTSELLDAAKKEKSVTLNDLYLIEHKIKTRNELIENISLEIELFEKLQDSIMLNIKLLEIELDNLKSLYAQTLRQTYKIKLYKYDIATFILSSENFSQAYKRLKYFQQIIKYEENQHDQIIAAKNNLLYEAVKVDSIIRVKSALLAEKTSESSKLISEKKSQKQLLDNLKSRENELNIELRKKKKNLKLLDEAITRFLEEEAKKAKELKKEFKFTPDEKLISGSFEKNMGILPWPTDKGIITGHYGEQKHPLFKHVVINNKGIDITTSPKSDVRTVFKGEVKNILTIPGFHKVIIIRHGEYLSLYGNLSQVNVKVGDNVETRQNIGIAHQEVNENHSIVHFELWKENVNLNPTKWIKN